ncbi:MAG: isoprenylcysteine carboxylmethyltransferase family protein [Candidatus Margulisbacteria bacterium]|nr:isoprenylcysteine carboxylmethyltransferase family protein [Candidatus Margulisiibacteriota bacterium]
MLLQFILIGVCLLGMALMWAKNLRLAQLGFVLWVAAPWIMPFMEQPRFWDIAIWQMWGAVAIAGGLVLAVWATLQLKKEASSGKLVMTGPYKHIRHPLYLGLVFVYVGLCWVMSAIYSFYFGLIVLAIIWLQAYLEEKIYLAPKFGDEFINYKKASGMFWFK